MAGRLAGKTALVTGAASGIGRAIAQLFLEEGAKVAIADIDAARAEDAGRELGAIGPVHVVVGDVAKMADGTRMADEAAAELDGLDVVVCGAGIPSRSRIAELTEEEWDRIIAVNLKGMYTVIHAAIPHLRRRGGGTIITMGSEMGFTADPNAPAYNASKGGVIMFTKSIAVDLIRENIRVNSLCPGITQTPLLDTEIATSEDPDATRAEFAAWAPIGRSADPREQAYGALFLACSESSFAVGTTLLIDGGRTSI